MTKLIVVIIIILAVLSTPLSLKKLIDRSRQGKDNFGLSGMKEYLEDPIKLKSQEEEDRPDAEKAGGTGATGTDEPTKYRKWEDDDQW